MSYLQVLVTLTLAASGLHAQTPAPRKLSNPVELQGVTFSSIRALRALGDGRLILSDTQEGRVFLVDFKTNSAKPLVPEGDGPREIRQVGGVYAGKGGSIEVYDQTRLRLLPITPDATLLDSRALGVSTTSRSASSDGPDQYAPDTLGSFVGQQIQVGPGGMADSATLFRTPAGGAPVVLARLRQPARRITGSSGNVTTSQAIWFSPVDLWAASPDGWVAVVRSTPYRVEWYSPAGKVTVGATVAHVPIKVTDADRGAIREIIAGGGSSRATVQGSGSSKPVSAPPVEPMILDVKPAFPGHTPRIDERGRVWVERSRTAAGGNYTYDVFDRMGTVVDRVELPNEARLVGFDAKSLYAARKDQDDLLHLQRIPIG